MSNSRTLILNQEVKYGLLDAAKDNYNDPYQQMEELDLPKALTVEEVGHIGIQIESAAERMTPSWDGYTNGARAEKKSIDITWPLFRSVR